MISDELTKFKKIAALAYENASNEIYHYIGWCVGAGLGMSLLYLFSLVNCRLLTTPQQYGVILSMSFAFITAGCLVLLLVICMCLAMYTVSFLHICYVYDNRSWVFVNAPLTFIRCLFKSDPERYKREEQENERYKKEFESEVAAIKEGTPKDSSCYVTEE